MKKLIFGLAAIAFLILLGTSGPVHARIDPQSVSTIWENLTRKANLTDAGSVNIEDKSEPNAWVSFGQNKYSVHATTGLLNILKNEDELSGVLSHEIGHIKLGHYNDTIKRSLLWLLLYKTLGERKVGGVDVLGAGMVLAESGFSREQEIAADDFGVSLSANAGYNPWGLYNSLQSMQKAGLQTSHSGFNSHPPTERRLTHIKATTEEVIRELKKPGSN